MLECSSSLAGGPDRDASAARVMTRVAATTSRVLITAALWLLLWATAEAADARNVLVLYSNNRLVPGNVSVDRGLRAALSESADRPIQTFSEFLDRPDFGGDAYEETVTRYLQEKYSLRPPDAIVAVSDSSLEFLLHHRARLFPKAPLIHAAVSKSLLQSLEPLPVDVVGVPIEYDYVGTIKQALRWHPAARHLIVVTGSAERDRERETRLRREVPAVAGSVSVEFLAGQTTASVLKRLRELDATDLVFTPGYFQDASGQLSNPRDSAALMASVANAPVYGPVDTFIGTGVVGGRMPSFEGIGRQAGQIVGKVLAGAQPASLVLPDIMPTTLQVDWRQVQRWGIVAGDIPVDAIVHYRTPSFWEAYRNLAVIAIALFLLQAAVIAALLFERRRRRAAEVAVQKQRIELAHASRLAVAGELTASIAHEINQPLGAVQTSADAAELILQSGGERHDDLVRIVARIRRDNLRASDVIRRLRALLASHEPERQPFLLGSAMSDVASLLRAECRRRKIALEFEPVSSETFISGDQTQIQQVLINLVLNAMDSVSEQPDDRRTVVVSFARVHGRVTITVRDRGQGISENDFPKLFDSFFSTKQKGMGIGLSIARTIVEAHGGRIWADREAGEGAAFHFELPAYESAGVAVLETT